MPPKKQDGVPGKLSDPEYVNGYQIGHQDGRAVGYAEGHAAGLKESAAGEAVAEAEKRGYERGFAAALESKRPPLFEAAKRIYEQHFDAPDDLVMSKIAALEDEYGEQLKSPDRGLLAGLARRRRLAAEAQRQAFVLAAKPKSAEGKDVAKRLAERDARAEASYEVVS